jgi:hypothetical protein
MDEVDKVDEVDPKDGAKRALPASPPGPLAATLLYLMLPLVFLACALISPDPVLAILASLVMTIAFWVAFYRLNPLWVGSELLILALATRHQFPDPTLPWILASAVAGGAGAWLTRRDAEEDDFYFLPLGAAVLVFLVLTGLTSGGLWRHEIQLLNQVIQETRVTMEQNMKEIQANGPGLMPMTRENWDQMSPVLGYYLLPSFIGLWILGLWLCGRLARRILGRLKGPRPVLMLFQIRQRYIFLLILGLILEIFSILSKREGLAYIAWFLLGVIGIAGFFEGLGVILFLVTIRRMLGRFQSALWLSLLGIVVALAFQWVSVVLGLADIWFDFRKLERLRRQIESDPGE